jgi:hypothetical protein
VKVWVFEHGITVPRGIIFVMTPPTVSIPRVSGAISMKTRPSVSSDD